MVWDHEIRQYGHWMQVRNYAPRTTEIRLSVLRRFAQWCEGLEIKQLKDVSPAVLDSYQRHLYRLPGKGLKLRLTAHTQIQHLIQLRSFFHWLLRSGVVDKDPTVLLELPRQEQHLPRQIFSLADIQRLLSVPDVQGLEGLRDRAILEMFYSTAMRASDLQMLNLADINLPDRVALLRIGKSRRDRYVPLGERCAHWLDRYLTEARPLLVNDNTLEACFVEYGERFKRGRLSVLVAQYLKKAGLPTGRGACHLLRHACATHMLHNGADIRSIQELLGHQHLSTTQIYTRVALTDLRKVHERTHPLHGL